MESCLASDEARTDSTDFPLRQAMVVMSTLPGRFAAVIMAFAPLFRQRTWHYVKQLLVGIGAILALACVP
jgi:hypothetical protein